MKKIFLLCCMLMITAFGLKAQTLLNESFDSGTLPTGWTAIDSDGDGYNWMPVTAQYATHTGVGCIVSASYDDDYGVPLTPDNWLITPAINLTGDATLTFWVVGQDASYCSENYTVYISTTGNSVSDFTTVLTSGTATDSYVQSTVDLSSYTGETVYIAFRHHNTTDMFYLNLDDVKIFVVPTAPTIDVVPTALTFGTTLLNDTSYANLNITSYYLTSDISVTSAAPFEISSDGVNYDYSVILASTDTVLYVRYIPTAGGTDNGVISFTSGSASADVTVIGTCLDCDNITLPLSQSFESVTDLSCWSVLSANTVNQIAIVTGNSTVGNASFRFNSYSSASNYNQYLITPELPDDVAKMVTFDYRSASGEESFKVGYSTTTNDISAFIWGSTISVSAASPWLQYMNAAIPEEAKYIAINYCSNYKYYLYIDNFVVSEVTGCMAPTSITASHINQNSAQINWNPIGLEEAWTVAVVEQGGDPDNATSEYVDVRPYLVENLMPSTAYDVYVKAECETGSSPWSVAGSFTTTPDCSNPSNPQVTGITGTSAVLSWTAAPYGVTSYTVEYGEAESGSTEQVFVDNATTVTLTGLNPETEYEYTITSECNSETLTPTPVAGTFTTGCLVGGYVVIGNGTESTYYYPSNSCYNYSTSEQIFTAAEMGNANTLHSVSFDCYSPASPSTRNLTIYLMHTTQISANGWLTMTGAEQVYSGNYTFTAGWNTINFDTTFAYNGTDNLAIIIDDNTGSYSCSNYFNGHVNSNGYSAYYYSDETNVNPMSPSNTPYTNSVRANIKFGGECDETSTCVAPVITEFTYTAYDATITWAPGYQESAWTLQYKAADDTAWTDEGSVVSPYTISNLLPDADYEIRLYSDCGSEMSTPAVMNFRTECAALIPPFTETFTDWDNNPSDCWSRYSGLASSVFAGGALTSTTSGWNFTNTNVFPVGHPKVNVYGSSCNYWLVTPAIDLTNMVDPELSFELALTDYGSTDPIEDPTAQQDDKFMVVVSTDNGQTWSEANATVWADQGSVRQYSSISNQGEEVSVSLAQYMGQTIKIAFYGESTTSGGDNDLHITNVHVGERAACPKPTNLSAQSTSSDTVILSWTDAAGDLWDVIYGPAGFDPLTSIDAITISGVTTTTYAVDGLAGGVVYDFYVRRDCGNGDVSPWSSFPVQASPYVVTMGTTGSRSVTGCGFTVVDDGGISGNYSNNCDYTLTIYPSDPDSLITISGTFSGEGTADYLSVYQGTTVDEANLLQKITANSGTVNVGPFTSEVGPITLKFHSDYSVVYAGFVINVNCVSIGYCRKPTRFASSGNTNTSASLVWSELGSATAWNVAYGATGFDPDEAVNIESVLDTTAVISDLTAGTSYDFYVQSDCGGETSEWVGPVTIIPGSFNMPVTGNATITMCGGTIYDNGGANGNYADNCNAYLTVNPETNTDLVSISGTLTAESASWDYLIIYDGDGTTELYHSSQSSSTPVTFGPIESTTGPLTIYFHSDGSTNYSGFALNVTCTPAPTCRKPMNFTVVGTTTTDAILSWTEMGTATTWNIEYGPTGFTPGQGTSEIATTNPYTVTGLTTATAYDFYIQADCGSDDVSEWSSVATATTDCDVIATFPFTENFDASTNLPNCWNNVNVTGTTVWVATTPSQGAIYSAHSGSNAAVFFQDGDGDQADLQMPTFDLTSLTNPVLTFWYTNESWISDIDQLTVYYRSSPTDNWAQLTSHSSGASTWTFDSLALPNPSATYQIKFNAVSNYGYGINIDDVTIMDANGSTPPVVTCDAPTALAATNVAQTSATINWQAGGSETAWNLQYKAASAANWSNSITVNTTPTYNLTGLTANTAYQVRVQAACSADETSDWTTASFTTLAEEQEVCPAPTNFRAEEITKNSVTLAWDQAAGTATEWEINYKAADAATWTNITVTTNPYTITDLTPETAYQAQIIAHCTNGVNSDASEIITFTTLPDGINNYVLDNSTSLYPNPTTGLFTISNEQCAMSTVDVYDVYGKLLMSVEVNGNVATIDATSLSAGVYFAKVETEKGVVTKRFVKK